MKTGVINASIAIVALLIIALAWHCLNLAWTVRNGKGTLYLILSFLLGALGIGTLIYLINKAKD